MPRASTEIETPAHAGSAPVPMLDAVAAMLRIAPAIGRNLSADEYAFFTRRYADGVPEDQIDALIEQYQQPAEEAPMRAAGGLRAV